jgi:MEMO1 family protein
MTGTSRFAVRPPAVAGQFYPAGDLECKTVASQLISASNQAGEMKWIGGIVPHAGWICSGAIAGEVIGTLARTITPDLVVVFGAVHTPLPLDCAVLSTHRQWAVPGGVSEVPAEVAGEIEGAGGLFKIDDRFHAREHAVEVEVPLIQAVWPNARLLPIEVPLIDQAMQIGVATARKVAASGLSAVYLASSDLTHYGPNYRFTPFGIGPEALALAKDNDRRLIQIVMDYAPDRIVPEVRGRLNACGGGAIAAMLSACREAGATSARVLRHATSFETLAAVAPQRPDNAVGYVGLVVG